MSFIEDYLLTTEGTEPPLEYHVWTMLSTIATFMGKRFWFNLGHLRFYPHLYTILVGDPGMKKTTAMGFGKGMVRDAGICPVASTQITKEALTMKMSSTIDGKPKKDSFAGRKYFTWEGAQHEYNQYAIFASELVDFIAVNPQGFLDFLTNAWDDPTIEVETKNKGCDYIANPCINFMGCMTPTKLKGYMKLSILTGGFARRTAFVFCSHKKIIPIPTRSHEQEEAYLRCVAFGKSIQTLCGPFDWTDEVKEFYTHWYTENQKTIKDKHPTLHGWLETKAEILFKLSMLISLAETRERVITLPSYRLALRYCDMVEKNLERVFEGSGINPNAQVAAQVCRMLEAMGTPMNKKHLEMMFFDQATDLNALRDTLGHLVNVGRLSEKVITVNGQIKGTLIATPECLGQCTDVQLVSFLLPSSERLTLEGKDWTAGYRPSDSLESAASDERSAGDQKPPVPAASPETAAPPEVLVDLSNLSNPAPDSPSVEAEQERIVQPND